MHLNSFKILILLSLFFSSLKAQSQLQFDKRFVESEDKWVAYRPDSNGVYFFGFIYIDGQAGLTLNWEGHFTISPSGAYVREKVTDTVHVKVRLQNNNVRVAFIPEGKFAELHIPPVPDWLKYYKVDTNSVQRLHRWGYIYNTFDMHEKALSYLLRARETDFKYRGVAAELAYTYNAMEQYEKALEVAEKAMALSLGDCYLYKELSYAQMHTGALEKAAVTYQTAVEKCKDNSTNAEIAYDIAAQYYTKKDVENFHLWAKETLRWAKSGDQFSINIKRMKALLNQ